jgi:hypothetical protein
MHVRTALARVRGGDRHLGQRDWGFVLQQWGVFDAHAFMTMHGRQPKAVGIITPQCMHPWPFEIHLK